MSLPTRKIGTSSVTAIGYGAMGIAAFYDKPQPDEERLKVNIAAIPHYICFLKAHASLAS
jgi:hypothetical protein